MYRALQLKKLHKYGNRNERKNSWYFASHSSKKGIVEKEEWQKFIARERKVVEGLMEVFAN